MPRNIPELLLAAVLLFSLVLLTGCLQPAMEKPVVRIPEPESAYGADTLAASDSSAEPWARPPEKRVDWNAAHKAVHRPASGAAIPEIRVSRNTVRVLLGPAGSSFQVRFSGPFALYSGAARISGTLKGTFTFTCRSDEAVVRGQSRDYPLRFMPLTRRGRFQVNGKRYRGALEVRPNRKRKPVLVNALKVEAYLKGVLPYELGKRDSIHYEALKVQAVAARTYTYARLGRHPEDGFDVYPDVNDQVYNGTQSEYELASKAVDATADLVLTHADTLIQAYYFSTSSGATANIEEVWPDKGYRPYLRTRSDSVFNTSSKYFFWKEQWAGKVLEKILNRNMPALFAEYRKGRLQNVYIEDLTACGRVKTLAVTIAGRTYRIRGDKTRWALRRPVSGNPILRSAWFRLSVDRHQGRVRRVEASGRGYGHGVGLSQIGALQMAADGKGFADILRAYYTDVRIARVVY